MFTPTISIEELPTGAKKCVIAGPIEVMVVNVQGNVYATQKHCTHAEANLAEGNLEGCIIECPLHGAMFDVRDGKVMSLPATIPLKTYPAKIENGVIMVDIPEESLASNNT